MFLLIDSSSQIIKITLLDKKNKVIDFLSWENDRKLSEKLLPKINLLLKKNNADFWQIKKVKSVKLKDPFSLISMRIGICVSQTMTLILDNYMHKIKNS